MISIDTKELEMILKNPENTNIEFKKSTQELTKDVYETVCSFSNRDGGDIFLGVADNGTAIGIDLKQIEIIKKNFVTSINNPQKIYPPLYLQIKEIDYHGKIILHILSLQELRFADVTEEYLIVTMIQMLI